MDINALKKLSYDELRSRYLAFLKTLGFGANTIATAYSDTFYLWRYGDHDLFWKAAESADAVAKATLLTVLKKNSTGNVEKIVNGYFAHIKRFRAFLSQELRSDQKPSTAIKPQTPPRRSSKILVPTPSIEQVELYHRKWDELENYRLQEDALDKLFFELCPKNTDIADVLLKVAALNDFYSTHIFSAHPVAKHILSLNIDARLKSGDPTLVNDIKNITVNGVERSLYSFASKYCSHHNPMAYPIYDGYVDKILRYFRDRDHFAAFNDKDLKDYLYFKDAIVEFMTFYGLGKYSLKSIDRYVWLLGKTYFPKFYGKKKVASKAPK